VIDPTVRRRTHAQIAVSFNPEALTSTQYDEIHRRLVAIGEHHNPHRLHHSGFGPEDKMIV
jgi:hypothetical protein